LEGETGASASHLSLVNDGETLASANVAAVLEH
jgi:hypothetical protein